MDLLYLGEFDTVLVRLVVGAFQTLGTAQLVILVVMIVVMAGGGVEVAVLVSWMVPGGGVEVAELVSWVVEVAVLVSWVVPGGGVEVAVLVSWVVEVAVLVSWVVLGGGVEVVELVSWVVEVAVLVSWVVPGGGVEVAVFVLWVVLEVVVLVVNLVVVGAFGSRVVVVFLVASYLPMEIFALNQSVVVLELELYRSIYEQKHPYSYASFQLFHKHPCFLLVSFGHLSQGAFRILLEQWKEFVF